MITVNGVKRTLEQPLSVTEYLEKNQYIPVQVAIELNDQILARELYGSTILKEGDVMEIVSFMGGGSGKNEEMDRTEDKLILGGHEFTSRFILGSGKFSLDLVKACIEKAGTQIITLALRRANQGGTCEYSGLYSKEHYASSKYLRSEKCGGGCAYRETFQRAWMW